jgi:hypothetical protein
MELQTGSLYQINVMYHRRWVANWSLKYLNFQRSLPIANQFTVHSGGMALPMMDLILSYGKALSYAFTIGVYLFLYSFPLG